MLKPPCILENDLVRLTGNLTINSNGGYTDPWNDLLLLEGNQYIQLGLPQFKILNNFENTE